MKLLSFISLFATLLTGRSATLDKAAEIAALDLEVGAVVTAEKVADNPPRFAIAGEGEPEGVPPEKLIFEIGSISKVFNGLLLAMAIEEGRVKAETTLGEVLDLEFSDPNVAAITLVQLATHTSGLPRLPDNLAPDPDALDDPYAEYSRDKLHAFLRTAQLDHAPPYPAAYSNLGSGLLGDILAQLEDTSWEALVVEKIAKPLGMEDTSITLGDERLRRFAPPYSGAETAHRWTFQALAGAGALRSTAADLVTFGEAFLFPEKTPFPAALKAVMEPHAEAPSLGGEIGLGLILSKLDGEREYNHNGGTGGYGSLLQVLPESRTIRVVLTNNNALAPATVLAAMRGAGKMPAAETIDLAPDQLAAFAGVYDISPEARFTVLVHGDALHARLTGQPFLPLRPVGDDRFRYEAVAAELRFEREGDQPNKLTLFQNGREIPAIRSGPAPQIHLREAAELKEYAGVYELAEDVVFTLDVRGDTLFAQLTGQAALPVFETGDERFEYDVVKAALEFERDDNGKIVALILDQNGRQRAQRR